MAKNMPRNTSQNPNLGTQNDSNNSGLWHLLDRIFNLDKIFGGEFPVRYIPRFLWVSVLIFLYISFSVNADKLIQQIDETRRKVEERKAASTSKESDLMKAGRQSELIKTIDSLKIGLEELKEPPQKIIIDQDEE
jgi:hypothetical protein